MSPRRGTTVRGVRIPDDLWEAFRVKAEQNGEDRSALIRAWITEYVEEA